MSAPPGRKALLFSSGGVPLALPLGAVREIVQVHRDAREVDVRGATAAVRSVASALGLPAGPGGYALVLEASGVPALRVDELRGIADLAEAEVFQLPARTVLPQPPPFRGAFLLRGQLYLELSPAGLLAPPETPRRAPGPLPEGLPAERELVCERGGRALAVPLSLLVQVIEPPRVFAVPRAAPGHRGLLYHSRALHPVFDAATLLGDPPAGDPRVLLLVDAGGATAGVLVDRVRGVGEAEPGGPIRRPAWDALDDVVSPHGDT
jgi:hypothetical protein